jgi:hypothetical protein
MSVRRKYDFKPGTKASSGQVDEELDNLVKFGNELESKIEVIKQTAQMYRLTNSDGSLKIANAANLNAYDIPGEWFVSLAQSSNKPPGTTYGKLLVSRNGVEIYQWFTEIGTISNGRQFFRQYTGSAWTTWTDNNASGKDIADLKTELTTQNGLWTGPKGPNPSTFSMAEYDTVVPSKKLADCRNGWVLVWSDVDINNNYVAIDADFVYSYIPKYANTVNGSSHLFTIAYGLSSDTVNITGKRIYVHNDKLVGHADNLSPTTGTADVCLRAVLEW